MRCFIQHLKPAGNLKDDHASPQVENQFSAGIGGEAPSETRGQIERRLAIPGSAIPNDSILRRERGEVIEQRAACGD
jgi:hypothetical protein